MNPLTHDCAFALTQDILIALRGSVPSATLGNLRSELYHMIREAVSRHDERLRLERKRLNPTRKEE